MTGEEPQDPWPALGLVTCVVILITIAALVWIGS